MSEFDYSPLNMHMHTHYSFNALGMSPAQLVDESVRRGIYAAAICDFDVLDGLEEFLHASDRAGLRAAVGLETRVFFSEFADHEINSPGEPGVFYFMGMGFGHVPASDSPAGLALADLRRGSELRNRALLARIREALPHLAVDYDRDVLPLTPSGNATERHMIAALIARMEDAAKAEADPVRVWSATLCVEENKARKLLEDPVALQNALRARLMKSGGVGYVQPDRTTFPSLESAVGMVLDAGAIPMATWLNGLSSGESDCAALLESARAKGMAAINIIPDRNWNISDAEDRRRKVDRLHEVVRQADRMRLPVNVGTEMNSPGQPFVDDFAADAMRPLWPVFLQGARVMVGQSRLARWAGFSYCGAKAEGEFGADLDRRNAFFASVGALECPDEANRQRLEQASGEESFRILADAAKAGGW